MNFQELPNEIILDCLVKSDNYAFCRVSKQLHSFKTDVFLARLEEYGYSKELNNTRQDYLENLFSLIATNSSLKNHLVYNKKFLVIRTSLNSYASLVKIKNLSLKEIDQIIGKELPNISPQLIRMWSKREITVRENESSGLYNLQTFFYLCYRGYFKEDFSEFTSIYHGTVTQIYQEETYPDLTKTRDFALKNFQKDNSILHMDKLHDEMNISKVASIVIDTAPLHHIILADNISSFQKLEIDYVNYRDKDDYSVLHLAAKQGSEKIVNFLLEQKMPQHPNTRGMMPIHLAIFYCHANVVKALLPFFIQYKMDKGLSKIEAVKLLVEYVSKLEKKEGYDRSDVETVLKKFKLD